MGGFRPTEAGVHVYNSALGENEQLGKCQRAVWFRLKHLDLQAEYSPSEMIRNDTGKRIEEETIELFKEMGIYVDAGVKFFVECDGIDLSGELDGVLEEPETKLKYAYECKSFYGYNAQKEILGLTHGNTPKPKMSHALQALCYLYYFKFFAKPAARLEYAILFYVERGDGRHIHFLLDIEEEVQQLDGAHYVVHRPSYTYFIQNHIPSKHKYPFTMEQVWENFKEIKEALKVDEPPPRDFEISYSPEKIELLNGLGQLAKTKYEEWKKAKKVKPIIGDWECTYCPYQPVCVTKEGKPIDFDKSLLKKKLPIVPQDDLDILI